MRHEIEEIGPIHSVRRFGNVQFDKKSWEFLLLQILDHLLHIHKVVMDASLFYEGRLVNGNDVIKLLAGNQIFSWDCFSLGLAPQKLGSSSADHAGSRSRTAKLLFLNLL
jgi:hypothetical protein